MPAPRRAPLPPRHEAVIVIGASLGGVAALEGLLRSMPEDAPPIVIVQHMPPGFTRRFAERCDGLCAVRVHEARDGDLVLAGRVLVAPGDRHLRLERGAAGLAVRVDQGPKVSGHRPSVDVLFDSAAEVLGADAVGVILTGMGRDGAAGLLRMRRQGARTIAQDQASCALFGMPQVAIEMGAADCVLPLHAIADTALQMAAWRQARVSPPEPPGPGPAPRPSVR